MRQMVNRWQHLSHLLRLRHADMLLSIGLIFIVIFASVWHFIENRQLTERLHVHNAKELSAWLLSFAWIRTLQLTAALVIGSLLIVSYSQQVKDSQIAIDKLKEENASLERDKQNFINEKTQLLAQINAAATALKTPAAAPAQQPAAAPAPAPSPTGSSVEDVYNPERSSTDAQSAMDAIKKRYEDVMVIHMFLKKCKRTGPDDYATITHGLAMELSALKAPSNMQQDVIDAANGAFKELYAKSPCNSTGVDALHKQYIDYLKVLTDNFPIR